MIWFLRLFHIFITDDSYILVTMQMFTLKFDAGVCDGFSGPS